MEDGRCTKDIKRRIGLALAMFGTMNKLWRSNNITTATKVKLYGTFVIPVMMYGSECWCLIKEDERRIIVIVISKFLKRYLKAKRTRAPILECCIKSEGLSNIVRGRLRSVYHNRNLILSKVLSRG